MTKGAAVSSSSLADPGSKNQLSRRVSSSGLNVASKDVKRSVLVVLEENAELGDGLGEPHFDLELPGGGGDKCR
ncbi:hypothetical protein ColKHC_04948 [Colletotrichum higginsianum]|nr:hypothetical protein ColKHC_04948 [Colletotrichum higginsianum]